MEQCAAAKVLLRHSHNQISRILITSGLDPDWIPALMLY